MPYPVRKLITNAYYTSGVVSRDFSNVDGSQINDGLDFLNDILSEATIEQDMVPYYQTQNLQTIAGQNSYLVPNLIAIETIVLNKDNVRIKLSEVKRREYFGGNKTNNILSMPLTYHVETSFSGANIYFYFTPDKAYDLELWGQFRLNVVSLDQDLSLTLDQFYISYLKYALAKRICTEFGTTINPNLDAMLAIFRGVISKRSKALDLQNNSVSTLGSKRGPNYARINLN